MTAFPATVMRRVASGLREAMPDRSHAAAPSELLQCAVCGAQPGRWAAVRLQPPTAWCTKCWEIERAQFAERVQ